MSEFLIQHFPKVSPETWLARFEAGEVVDEQGAPLSPHTPYRAHVRVHYYRAIEDELRLPFDEAVLFQDEHIVVADKPHFLPVTPGGRYLQETLLVRLKRKLGIDTLAPMHRLDRETAGLVLFSIQPSTRGRYQAMFAQRDITKHYDAVAPWMPNLSLPLVRQSRIVDADHFMCMHEVPGEPNAETRVEVLRVQGDLALYRLSPVTGRKHQLRVHCAALGMPIVNDLIYPKLFAMDSDDHDKPLQLLAKSVAFRDPVTGEARQFSSQRSLMLA
jgi:tRNA pseudouridine32 synthase/23S rRNA pseudouridine746 synthase